MATEVLTNAAILVDGYDLSGHSNALALQYGAEMKDATVFGEDTRINKGGLKTVMANGRGFYETGTAGQPDEGEPDAALFSRIGTKGLVTSLAGVRTVGQVAYLFTTTGAVYELGGQVGELLPYSLDLEGAGVPLVRGRLMADQTSVGSSGNGTAVQVGAVASGQRMYAALHVLAASGTTPTLDVTVESDDASGMGSPTTRITFAQATGVTSEWASVAGAITDDWWRIAWSLGGTTPSFDFLVTIGIL